MLTQAEKGVAFEALHKRDGTFIIPNPYDAGTARLLENLGFEALATSSAGYAFTTGKADNAVGREGTMDHATAVAAATDLPLSIDLENGFGDAPESVAKTIRLAAGTGAVGGSIEDATGRVRRTTLRAYTCDCANQSGGRSCSRTPLPFHANGARRKLSGG